MSDNDDGSWYVPDNDDGGKEDLDNDLADYSLTERLKIAKENNIPGAVAGQVNELDETNHGVKVESVQNVGYDCAFAHCQLLNFGKVVSDDFVGARLYGFFGDFVDNIAGGLISGGQDGVDMEGGTGQEIDNSGRITGIQLIGISFDTSSQALLQNRGYVFGGSDGVLSEIAGVKINNSGIIKSNLHGIFILTTTAVTTIINNQVNGRIEGQTDAIHIKSGRVHLVNQGTIVGNIVDISNSPTKILNLTKINGSVYLGGNSIFDGSAGSSGPIHVAGGGNIIKGGLGADRFVFDGALAGRADTITNFQHGLDKIELSETIDFPGLGPHGALHPSHFHLGAPVNGHPQIDYFKSTGVLEYYPNGRFGTADHFATLTNHPNVSASDFSLIA